MTFKKCKSQIRVCLRIDSNDAKEHSQHPVECITQALTMRLQAM